MKHIQIFEDFKPDPDYAKGGKNYADINEISEVFEAFIESVRELAKKNAFKHVNTQMESVIESIDSVWEELCDEHGVEYDGPIREIKF